MLATNSNAPGQPMPRDPRDPIFIETADSFAQAQDHNRRSRAAFLMDLFTAGFLPRFDHHFIDYYGIDNAIILFLSDAAASRGFELIDLEPREVQ